ncbi:MAG: hypothetical protein IK152_04170 [Lachnospiraceae bacterium]|nr:hypothetical protein [Lachnospiraceae bacterium]
MSQAKVEAYKNDKVNRKENLKKDKRMRGLRTAIVTCLVVALLAWAGVSLYGNITNQQKNQAITVNYTDITNYMQTLEPSVAE